jgi:hypothetical protein
VLPPESAYYPPRAGRLGRFRSTARTLLRRIPFDAFERLRLPRGFSFRKFSLALALPGYVFLVVRQVRAGQILMGAYALLFLVAVVWIGSGAAALAFGLLVALHGASWARLIEVWLPGAGWKQRLLLTLCATLLVATLCYRPAQRFIQHHWVAPLRLGNQTLLVNPARPPSLRPGVAAVIRVEPDGAAGLMVLRGFVVAEILGQPGDRIQFADGWYRVNDLIRPALTHMPIQGEWIVPENHWFIWPFSSMGIQGRVAEADPAAVQTVLRRLALVPWSSVAGRPLRWWFWRNLYVP